MNAMRLLNLVMIVALVLAAAYVYRIKFESTLQAERVAKLRAEIRRERDMIASLRAEWARLDNPGRIQGLARRHLELKPIDPSQFGALDSLPMRPPSLVPPDSDDPIGAMIEDLDQRDVLTGSVPAPAGR
jgi:cell division protein FtsL